MKPVEIEFLMKDRLSGGIDNARMKSDLLDASLKRMAATIGTAFTLTKAIEFGKVMMDVRGQIESFQISFQTLIGSKDKANAFFAELKNFATNTPLMLDDLAKNAQTFLGFGIETEKVIPILKQIGDVTMGNKDRFNAMSLAFAQMYATGKLQGQDLLQMINAGFNPLITISERTGKSVKQLKEEMSEGAISAEMVAQAFADVTSEGGKFNGMLAKQSDGWNGMKAQFQGAVQHVLNEMGTTSQGIMTAGMQTGTSLVKNYETVGKVLVGLIATYGSYKAAVLAVTVAEKINLRLKEQATLEAALLTGSTQIMTASDLRAAGAKKVLTAATMQLTQALKASRLAMLANPYVAITVAVVALVAAIWALSNSTSAEEKAQKKLNDTLEDAKKKKEDLKSKTNELIGIIKDETQTIYAQVKAYEELKKAMPKAFSGMSREQIASMSPEDMKKAINEATDSMEFDAVNKMFTDAQKKTVDLEKQLQSLMSMPSPQGGNGGAIMYLSKQIEKAQAEMNEAKKKLDEINRIKIQAEFDAKPVKEKIAYYESEIEKLDTEKRQLDTLLLGHKDITGEWGQINWQTMQNISHLEFVNKKLNEMKGNLSALQNVPANANYGVLYDEAKKNWETAKKTLADISKNRSKYTKEEYEIAKTNEASTKKTFSDLGGDTNKTKSSGSSGLTAKEKANILAADQKAREKQIQEYTASLVAQQKQSEFDIRQARIDAMKESIDKEKAAIQLNYDKLIEETRQREEKWVKDLQGKTDLEYENKNPDWKKKGLSGPAQKTASDLTADQTQQLKDYTDAAIQYRDKAEEKLYNDLLGKYKTFAEQYYDIAKKYQDDIDVMKSKGASEENIVQAEQAKTDALTALDEEFAQKEETFKDLMARIGYMSLQQLERTLKQAENTLANSNINNGQDSRQSATLRAKIKKLQEEIKAVQTENEIKDSDQLTKWEKTEKAIRDCKGEIDGMLDSMDFLDEETKSALQAASNIANGAIAMINGIKMLGIGAAASISTVEKASIILAIVGAAVQIITAIFNMASAAEARHQEALNEIAREKTAFQREYNLLLIEQNELLKNAETIFGVNAYGKALGSIRQMKKALDALNKEIKGQPLPDWMKGMPFGIGSQYEKQMALYRQDIQGLYGIEVKTGHKKTGLFGWGKGKDIYSSVLDVYPDLLDANGKFNASLAETIMNTRTLSDEDKATLQQMIDLSNLMEEAFQAVKDYLSDIFGELGNTMSDALADAFRNGTDAAEKFTESVTSMLEDLAEQMIYTVTIAPYLEKAQEDMLNVMKDEKLTDKQKFNNYVGILDGMMDDVLAQQGTYNSLLEQYRKMAAEKGINLWEADSKTQSGKAGAYETASQDSITRLEGLYSSMLEHEISIEGGVENIVEGMNAALTYLQRIEENTDHLGGIKTAIQTMRDDIATIKRDGVKTR